MGWGPWGVDCPWLDQSLIVGQVGKDSNTVGGSCLVSLVYKTLTWVGNGVTGEIVDGGEGLMLMDRYHLKPMQSRVTQQKSVLTFTSAFIYIHISTYSHSHQHSFTFTLVFIHKHLHSLISKLDVCFGTILSLCAVSLPSDVPFCPSPHLY